MQLLPKLLHNLLQYFASYQIAQVLFWISFSLMNYLENSVPLLRMFKKLKENLGSYRCYIYFCAIVFCLTLIKKKTL